MGRISRDIETIRAFHEDYGGNKVALFVSIGVAPEDDDNVTVLSSAGGSVGLLRQALPMFFDANPEVIAITKEALRRTK